MDEKIVKDSQGLVKDLVNDTISRQAAIEAIKEDKIDLTNTNVVAVFKATGDFEKVETQVMTCDRHIKILKDLPSAQPEPRWIPCGERLPEEGERVLATHLGGVNPNNQVIEHIYQCGKFTRGWDMDMNVDSPTFGQRYMGEVIAWMPLPEPYEERR